MVSVPGSQAPPSTSRLLASSGSDFHAPGEGGRDVGLTQPLPEGCLPVWERLGLSPADYAETL